MDQFLGVTMLPWCGECWGRDNSKFRISLLILGESHYNDHAREHLTSLSLEKSFPSGETENGTPGFSRWSPRLYLTDPKGDRSG